MRGSRSVSPGIARVLGLELLVKVLLIGFAVCRGREDGGPKNAGVSVLAAFVGDFVGRLFAFRTM